MPWASSRSSWTASASCGPRVGEREGRLARGVGLLLRGVLQAHGEPDEALLGAVVQMTLEPAALRLGGDDQADP